MTAAVTETNFSDELRRATGRSHGDAQHSPFMSALFAGELPRGRYANLVAQYFYIYGALEERGMALENTTAAAFIDSGLTRIPGIEADLRYFLGPGWRSEIRPLVTTLEYVGRILDATPEQFVAHHYVRYLGDLSGGQHIAKVIKRQFTLESAGLAFYDFTQLGDPDAFKNAYRARLDAAEWDNAGRAAVIAEALRAYDLNTRLLQEL
jgi:heme oxygenase